MPSSPRGLLRPSLWRLLPRSLPLTLRRRGRSADLVAAAPPVAVLCSPSMLVLRPARAPAAFPVDRFRRRTCNRRLSVGACSSCALPPSASAIVPAGPAATALSAVLCCCAVLCRCRFVQTSKHPIVGNLPSHRRLRRLGVRTTVCPQQAVTRRGLRACHASRDLMLMTVGVCVCATKPLRSTYTGALRTAHRATRRTVQLEGPDATGHDKVRRAIHCGHSTPTLGRRTRSPVHYRRR